MKISIQVYSKYVSETVSLYVVIKFYLFIHEYHNYKWVFWWNILRKMSVLIYEEQFVPNWNYIPSKSPCMFA